MAGHEAQRGAQALLKVARGDGAHVEPQRLGERVRQLRQAREWTLEEAGRRAGLARSTLSKIENGQMSPTFEAVQKLARGLGVDAPQLFQPPVLDSVSGRRALTQAGRGEPHPTPTYEHDILCGELSPKRMLPYRTTVRARAFEDFGDWVRHDGEEFLFVLTGQVRLLTEFYAPTEMSPGDSAYYDAAMGHCVISVSRADAVILWVTSL